MNIIDAIEDLRFFRPLFRDLETWKSWKVFLKTLYGIPIIDRKEKKILHECTGLRRVPKKKTREAYVVAGRRSGKSWISAVIACYMAMFKDWSKFLNPGERGFIFIVSVDKFQSSIIKRYISGILHSNKSFEKMIQNETAERIDLTNNISIMIKTASYRSIRGFTVCVALIDKIAFFRSDESANPDREILTALRPCLSTIPESLLISISTPYNRRGILFDQYKSHFGKEDGTLVWKAPTSLMNPTIEKRTIDTAKKEDPIGARAEWDAEFRDDIETFLPLELIEQAVVLNRLELPNLNDLNYFGFVDPSGGRKDSMTLAISHKDPESGKYILDLIREVKPPFRPQETVAEFSEILKRYNVYEISSDRYAEAWVEDAFRDHEIRIEHSKESSSDIYLNVLPLFSDGQIELLDNPRLVSQLRNLERLTRSGGRDVVSHPRGLHDDVANSVCGSILRTYEDSNYVRVPPPSLGYVERPPSSLKEDLDKWAVDWLLDRKPGQKTKEDPSSPGYRVGKYIDDDGNISEDENDF